MSIVERYVSSNKHCNICFLWFVIKEANVLQLEEEIAQILWQCAFGIGGKL